MIQQQISTQERKSRIKHILLEIKVFTKSKIAYRNGALHQHLNILHHSSRLDRVKLFHLHQQVNQFNGVYVRKVMRTQEHVNRRILIVNQLMKQKCLQIDFPALAPKLKRQNSYFQLIVLYFASMISNYCNFYIVDDRIKGF